jgi:hypothetical protein
MRRTRFMSLFFAVLALAFFAVPAFREAFELPMTAVLVRSNFEGGNARFGEMPQSKLDAWARQGEANRDAKALAFVAMRTGNGAEAFRLADEATAIDPSLNWVYLSLAWVNRSGPEGLKIAQKLQALDPNNALGYLQEAEYIRAKSKQANWLAMDERAAQTEWRAVMEKAFQAPYYRAYSAERFELERRFLMASGEATPLRMLQSVASYPVVNMLNIRQYGELLTRKVGKDAEEAGKPDEAMAQYWRVAHVGERMQLGAGSYIEQLIGIALQQLGYKALVPVMEKRGQGDAAATLTAIMQEQQIRLDQVRGRNDIFSASTNYTWTAFLIFMLEATVIVSAFITIVSFAYVNAKRWIRPERKGRIFALITVAENYVPILLFLSCAGLYLAYYPYAANFRYYMTEAGGMRDYEAFFRNIMPLPDILVGKQLPFGNPFVPYAWYALAGLAVVLALAWSRRRREEELGTPKAAAAAGS